MSRLALCIFSVFALAIALAACGSSGASQDELDRARTEGAVQAKQQSKIEGIENQLKSLKKHGGNAPNGSSTSPPPSSGGTSEVGGTNCGGSLSVGANTTCAFAENVQNDYFSEVGAGAGTVVSYSPATGRLYDMYCTAGEPHVCTGGNDASVYFP